MLSEDEGKTWKYKLRLDGRNLVSYPDSKEADDGYIYKCAVASNEAIIFITEGDYLKIDYIALRCYIRCGG